MKKPAPKTWLIIAGVLVAAYLLYRRAGSAATVTTSAAVPASTPDTSSGLVPSAGSSAGGNGASDALLASYGSERQDLLGALATSQANVLELAGSQLAYNASQTTNGAIDTSTGAAVGSQPGGSNAPSFSFVFPNVRGTVTKAAGAAKTKAATTQAPSIPSYSTYKRDVKLKAGQTVHYATGKGYYGA